MIKFLKNLFSANNATQEEDTEKNNKKNFDILKYDGIRAQNIRKWAYAEKCFKEALNIQPDMEVMRLLINNSIQLNNLELATEVAKQATEVYSDKYENFINLAHIYYMCEKYDDMLIAAQQATRLNPENENCYYTQAQAYQKQGDVINTIATLTQAIGKNDKFTEAYLMRSKVLLELRQINEAKADIDTLLKQDPENEEALLIAGNIEIQKGNEENAIRLYNQVIELNPFNEQAYIQTALLFINKQDWEKALEQVNEALENTETAALYQLRGKIKLETGDKNGSIEDVKKAMELNPEEKNSINGTFNNFDSLYNKVNPLG